MVLPRTPHVCLPLAGMRSATYREPRSERCSCGAWLSAYNPETSCSACSRRDREAEMRDKAKDRAKVVELFHEHPGEALTRSAVAAATGLPERAVAQYVSRLAREHNIVIGKMEGQPAYIFHFPRTGGPPPDSAPCPPTEPQATASGPSEEAVAAPEALLQERSCGDPEVDALGIVIGVLEELGGAAQRRVAAYVVDRYGTT